ncbi:MAG: DEAD/DEAH box helicase [Nanoarchaeota archaeon]
MKSFKELGLSPELLKVIDEIHFKEPSEVQEKSIPEGLAGKDVLAESATGSGKTLAFGAPIIQNAVHGKGLQALVLVPTRELAQQVSKSLIEFSKYKKLNIISVYGGISLLPQMEGLGKADIVVGTPGRILDHISRKSINLSHIKFLVLDEADRMLDMGFLDDVARIIERCPEKRQSFLFSATLSTDIMRIAKRYMNHPIEISAESHVDPSKLEQVFYEVQSAEKFSLLVHLLKDETSKLVMVFCNTKRNTDFIGKNLMRHGFDAMALHGDLSQSRRNKILEHFNDSDKFILVCTDVAARGLDIKNVSHVYNYDSPKNSTEYVHRIGRTARAGKDGKAITIIAKQDFDNFRRVVSDDSLSIKRIETPEFEKVFIKMSSERGSGDRGGGFRGRSSGEFHSRGRSGSGGYGGRSHGSRDEGRRDARGHSHSSHSSGGYRSRDKDDDRSHGSSGGGRSSEGGSRSRSYAPRGDGRKPSRRPGRSSGSRGYR